MALKIPRLARADGWAKLALPLILFAGIRAALWSSDLIGHVLDRDADGPAPIQRPERPQQRTQRLSPQQRSSPQQQAQQHQSQPHQPQPQSQQQQPSLYQSLPPAGSLPTDSRRAALLLGEVVTEDAQRSLARALATARRAEEAAAHDYSPRKSPAPSSRQAAVSPLPPLPRPLLPPLSEEPALPLAAEFSPPTPVPDTIGNLYFIGLYRNTGEATISLPRVELTLWNRDRQELAVATGFAVRHSLAKGETTPVKVLFTHAPAYAEVSARLTPQRERYGRPRPPLELGEGRLERDRYLGYRVTGTVKNPGPAAAQYVQIIALLYDAQERIVGMDSHFIAQAVLSPGQQSPFAVAVPLVNGTPKRVQLDYQASEVTPRTAPLR